MFHDSGPLARNSLRFAVLGESGAGWLVAFSWLGRKEVFVRAMLENGNVLWDNDTSLQKDAEWTSCIYPFAVSPDDKFLQHDVI